MQHLLYTHSLGYIYGCRLFVEEIEETGDSLSFFPLSL